MTALRTRFFATLAVFAVLGVLITMLAPRATSAGGAVPVQVTGTVGTVRLDDPDGQPFGIRIDANLPGGYSAQNFTVPAGKRLVIDYISGETGAPSGAHVDLIVATYINGQECELHLPMIAQGIFSGRDTFTTSNAVKIYADSGSTVTLSGSANSTTAGSFMTISIYGHYINVP